jgi:hypothetical protein
VDKASAGRRLDHADHFERGESIYQPRQPAAVRRHHRAGRTVLPSRSPACHSRRLRLRSIPRTIILGSLRSVASRACLLVGDIKALRALLAALGCIAAVLDHAPRHPNLLNLSANGVPGTLKQRIRAAASLYRAAQHYAATPRADAERTIPAPAREERGGTPSRRGWLPDRRRVHDHVRDGRDGRYGVVLLRDKEVDG